MLQVETFIYQAGEKMKTKVQVEPVIHQQDSRQLKLSYRDEETNTLVSLQVDQTVQNPVIHLERSGDSMSSMAFAGHRKTQGEYLLGPQQRIVFDIVTQKIEILEGWQEIVWSYQLFQHEESLGEFEIRMTFLPNKD